MADVKSNMRLDRFLSTQIRLSRKETNRLIRKGSVSVDGAVVKNPGAHVNAEESVVAVNGNAVQYREYIYIMMNKPAGTLSASRDHSAKTVLDLLPDAYLRRGLFPAGRLDKDTTGLMIITNDGTYAHNMLSPKKHVSKLYLAQLQQAVTDEEIQSFRAGINYRDISYASALLTRLPERQALVQIGEGKYHQVKRMFEACENRVIALKRVGIGGLPLDERLKPGDVKLLSAEEANLVFDEPFFRIQSVYESDSNLHENFLNFL